MIKIRKTSISLFLGDKVIPRKERLLLIALNDYMKRNYIFFLIITLLMGNFLPSLKAMAMSIETRFHYTEGDYGTGQKATFMSFPLEITGQPLKGISIGMTIPYVYQKCSLSQGYTNVINTGSHSSTGSIVTGGSTFSPKQKRMGQSQKSIKAFSPNNKSIKAFSPDSNNEGTNGDDPLEENVEESEYGMGDIFLSFSLSPPFSHDRLPPYVPSLDFSGVLKLPTAEPEKGLGTGEYDYTLGIKLNWKVSFIEPYLYSDYTWIGDTAEEDFENVFSFGCGTGLHVSRRNTVFLELSGCSSLYPEDPSPLSFQVGVERAILSRSWIYGYGLVGINEESPDFGFGVSSGISFD